MKFRQKQKNVRVGADPCVCPSENAGDKSCWADIHVGADPHARADTGVCPYIIAVLIFSLLLFFPPRTHAQSLQEKQTGFAARQEVCGNTKSSQGHPVADQNEEGTVKLNVVIPGITDQCGWVLDVTGDRNGNMLDYVVSAYTFLIAAAAFLALIMVMYGGFMWVFAGGNSSVIGKAKETITSAIIGLVLALLSVTILQQINPKLVDIEIPGIDPVVKAVSFAAENSCTESEQYIAFFPSGTEVANYFDSLLLSSDKAKAVKQPVSQTNLYTQEGEVYKFEVKPPFPSTFLTNFFVEMRFIRKQKVQFLRLPSEVYVEKVGDAGYIYPQKADINSAMEIVDFESNKNRFCGVLYYPVSTIDALAKDSSLLQKPSGVCNGLACGEQLNVKPEEYAACIQLSQGINVCRTAKEACERTSASQCGPIDASLKSDDRIGKDYTCAPEITGKNGFNLTKGKKCVFERRISCPLGTRQMRNGNIKSLIVEAEKFPASSADFCIHYKDNTTWEMWPDNGIVFDGDGYRRGPGVCCLKNNDTVTISSDLYVSSSLLPGERNYQSSNMTNFVMSNIDRGFYFLVNSTGRDNKVNFVAASGIFSELCNPKQDSCTIEIGEEKIIEDGKCKEAKDSIKMRILTERRWQEPNLPDDEFPLYVTIELRPDAPYFYCAKNEDTDVQIEYVDVSDFTATLDKSLTYDEMMRKIYEKTTRYDTFEKCTGDDNTKICVPRYKR